MRPELDKEFDALLRRLAGGAGTDPAPGSGARPAPSSPHLDADERAAFAEGALPPAARAAYVSHLADCDDCRRTVTGLSAAAGVAFALDRREEAGAGAQDEARRTARGSWLRALLAPRVLRFAAPALALCLVGVVSFVALRSDRGRQGMTARQAGDLPHAGADSAPNSSQGAAAANASMTANSNDSATAEASKPAGAEVAGTGTTGRPPESQGAATGAGTGPAVAASSETRADERPAAPTAAAPKPQGEEQAGLVTPAPPPPAPVAAESREESRRQEAERGRDMNQVSEAVGVTSDRANRGRANDAQQAPDGSRGRSRSYPDSGGGAPPTARGEMKAEELPPAGRRAARRPLSNEADGDGPVTVEGRRFRRVGGVWVDANYKDSLPSTGVRRGTQEYRALVAELPEVGRVAERLAGEVVVVARGRAYRVRP